MIWKQTRIKAGGGGTAEAHVLKMTGNVSVTQLYGDFADLRDAEMLAEIEGQKYSLRHIVISPERAIDVGQVTDLIRIFDKEFGRADRRFVIMQHKKTRANGNAEADHYHVLMEEADSHGNILDSSHMYARNEKMARLAEIAFGHDLTKGRHNRAVAQAFAAEGNHFAVAAMLPLTEGRPARASFGSIALRKAERLGVDLPAIVHAISQANPTSLGATLAQLEKNHEIRFMQGGDQNVVLLITAAGKLIFNAFKSIAGVTDASTDAVLTDLSRARSRRDGSDNRKEAGGSYSVDVKRKKQLGCIRGYPVAEQATSAPPRDFGGRTSDGQRSPGPTPGAACADRSLDANAQRTSEQDRGAARTFGSDLRACRTAVRRVRRNKAAQAASHVIYDAVSGANSDFVILDDSDSDAAARFLRRFSDTYPREVL